MAVIVADCPTPTFGLLDEMEIEIGVWRTSGPRLKQPTKPSEAAKPDSRRAFLTTLLLSQLIGIDSGGQQSWIVGSAEIGAHMAGALKDQRMPIDVEWGTSDSPFPFFFRTQRILNKVASQYLLHVRLKGTLPRNGEYNPSLRNVLSHQNPQWRRELMDSICRGRGGSNLRLQESLIVLH